MDTAAADLGLQTTTQFFETVIVTKNEEKEPFITQKVVNNIHEEQTFFEKYKVHLLRLRVPSLIVVYTYYGYSYTVPYLPIPQICIILWFIPTTIILFVTFWTFYVGAYSHPGRVPIEYLEWNGSIDTKPNIPIYSEISETAIISSGYKINPNDKDKLFCNKCNKYRPLRTHHCSQCSTCIARMDHHCDFLSNCVGINNHRYFTQFLCWVFFILFDYQITYYYSYPFIKEKESYFTYIGATFMWYFGILIECWLIVMITTNFKYIFNNDTLLELKFKIAQFTTYGFVDDDIKPFHRGSKCENFKIVCGTSKIRWFFPLKWTQNDLDKRMMSHSYMFDICPWSDGQFR